MSLIAQDQGRPAENLTSHLGPPFSARGDESDYFLGDIECVVAQ